MDAPRIAAPTDASARRNEHLVRALERIAEGVIILDSEGRYTYANAAAQRILRLTPGQLIDTYFNAPPWTRLTAAGEPMPDDQSPFAVVRRTGQPVSNMRFIIVHPDGARTVLSLNASPLPEADGSFGGMVASFVDITDLVRAARALAEAKAEAERASAAKNEFLSRMSHELRTPLNAILGFGQLLLLDELSPQQRESAGYIVSAGRHLLELINEVLDITRIEAGRIGLSSEPVDLHDLTLEVLSMLAPLAESHNVQMEMDASVPPALHVQADRQRLKQVLLNLIDNAIKYNRPGGVVLILGEQLPDGFLRLAVRDTGPGIPEDAQSRLFTPFERLGMEGSAVEGTGLGLALARRLVEAMGGSIGVESHPGNGSRFWVDLPRVASPAEQADLADSAADGAAPAGPTAPTRTLLYIEDNLSNLKLVQRILAHRPAVSLLSAMQGRLGLDLARLHRPDMILLDLHLPDMNGTDVLHNLQRDPATASIPVVVLSADATPGQIERLRAAGVWEYLTKPLDVERFLGVVDTVLMGAEGVGSTG